MKDTLANFTLGIFTSVGLTSMIFLTTKTREANDYHYDNQILYPPHYGRGHLKKEQITTNERILPAYNPNPNIKYKIIEKDKLNLENDLIEKQNDLIEKDKIYQSWFYT
jgi:hypothetical protein